MDLLLKTVKINCTEASVSSYNSAALWSENQIVSIIFVPGARAQLQIYIWKIHLKNEMWHCIAPFETLSNFRSPVISKLQVQPPFFYLRACDKFYYK